GLAAAAPRHAVPGRRGLHRAGRRVGGPAGARASEPDRDAHAVEAHSLAGFRGGYAVLPEPRAHDLNTHNDASPLARPSEAAALATLRNEPKIATRLAELKSWTAELAAELRTLGVRTYPTRTYFFLADFAPHDAAQLATELKARNILVKALTDPRLGKGFMRITTALPRDNARFVENLRALLRG